MAEHPSDISLETVCNPTTAIHAIMRIKSIFVCLSKLSPHL